MDETERDRRQQAALAWINERWTNLDKKCPICGQSGWGVGTVYEMREYEDGNLVLGGGSNILPAFPVTCTTCGHIYWFNAVQTGVIKAPAPILDPPPTDGPNGSDSPA
jgi:hypothetical protein